MAGTQISLDRALDLTRTGDVWLFRGRKAADRAIQVSTNSPVNHVGMTVALEDLPPLMWHAELGRRLPDLWSGTHQRGVQLHDLHAAIVVWGTRYGQQAWLRQLEPAVTADMEDAVLRTIARLDGTPFPSTARLAARWLSGRLPRPERGWLPGRGRGRPPGAPRGRWSPRRRGDPGGGGVTAERPAVPSADSAPSADSSPAAAAEAAYCAEVVAVTYQAMGLLPDRRRPNWYDPGRFWSGDDLALTAGARLGGEISVLLPPSVPRPSGAVRRS